MCTRISYRALTLCLALLLAAVVSLAACDTVQASPETEATTPPAPVVTTAAPETESDVTTATETDTTAPETTTETEPVTESETPTPDVTARAFDMSYAFASGETATVGRGSVLSVTLTIRNDGEAFELMGSSSGFAPTARLVKSDGSVTVDCLIPHTNDFVIFTVETGKTSSCHGDFLLDGGVATGSYDLVLSFGDESVTFEDVVTVE